MNDQTTARRNEVLVAVWDSIRFCGEPVPSNPQNEAILNELADRYLLYRTNYKGEECFGVTTNGAKMASEISKKAGATHE